MDNGRRLKNLESAQCSLRSVRHETDLLRALSVGVNAILETPLAAAVIPIPDGTYHVGLHPDSGEPATQAGPIYSLAASTVVPAGAGPGGAGSGGMRVLMASQIPPALTGLMPGGALVYSLAPRGAAAGTLLVALGEGQTLSVEAQTYARILVADAIVMLENLRLLSGEAMLKVALDHAFSSFMLTDIQGHIIYVNPAFERVTGYSAVEVLGQTPNLLKSGMHTKSFYDRMWEQIRAGNTWQGEVINKRKGGELYDAKLVIAPVKDTIGRTTHYLASHRDITQEKAISRRLREKVRELDLLNHELDEFVARVSHDLKEPLRGIEAFGSFLVKRTRELTDPKAQQYAGTILDLARTVKKRLFDLLKLSRVGKDRRIFTRVELSAVVREVLRELAFTVKRRKAKIRVEKLPAVMGNKVLLIELFTCLLANALKYVKGRPPEVIVRLHEPVQAQSDTVTVEVRDNGIGIEERDFERIFAPFFRVRTDDPEGTGIGLTIARKVVDRHGGRIWVESTTSVGSTFFLTLPAAEGRRREGDGGGISSVTFRPVAATPVTLGEPAHDMPAHLRLLLVEEDPLSADIITEALAGTKLFQSTVEQAVRGDEVVRKLGEIQFDLVILDYEIPGEDGLSLLGRILGQHPHVPVVMVTAHGDERVAAGAIKAGAMDYIPMDEVPSVLARAIASVIERVYSTRALERLKSDLVGIVSHDLKSPVGNVLNYSEMLAASPVLGAMPAPEQKAIGRIRENALYMLELINDILDTSRIDSGKMRLLAAPHDLTALIRECIDRNTFLAHDKGIRLEVELPDRSIPVSVDKGKIMQVLNNLLSNALKFSDAGTCITCGLRVLPLGVEVWVKDQGQGIRPEEVEKLFKKFSRTSVRATRGEKGTGLGLYIVSEFVKLHRGEVRVQTEVGKGSTFSFVIPGEPPPPATLI